ncbi:MAG: hypothetical protein ABIX28_14705 [Vicinamibacterales bacterium]
MFRVGSALLLLVLAPAVAFAQPGPPQVITPSHQDVSPPLRDLPPAARHVGDLEAEPVRVIPSSRNPLGPDQVVQRATSAPTLLAPTLTRNFDGVGQGFTGPAGTFTVNSAPPDNNGAVGKNHFVEIVNTEFAVFTKAGVASYGPVPVNTVFGGFGGGCQNNNDGDPTVVYDRLADRWIISQFSVSNTPYLQCVAVSTGADPAGSYYRYSFAYANDFPDYPKMGVWPDGYYTTYNMFRGGVNFIGAKACAFDRAKMLIGGLATQVCFDTGNTYGGLLPADLDGASPPPTGAPNYVIALGATSTTLALWKFHVNFSTPSLSTFQGPTTIAVPSYAEACSGRTCIPQSGGGSLDSLADRLMYRAAYRNFGDHEALVVNHAVTAGSSVGVRWYEIRNLSTGTPAAFQASTYAPDATYRWMGSIAMDKNGNMALGYSASSNSIVPQIRFTGRLAGDAQNQMTQSEGTIIAGTGAQLSGLSRWGDYTSMAIDPSDDCTFWYTNQYLKATGTFNWSTRIASFVLPGCGGVTTPDFALSASPASVTVVQGGTGTSTITVTPTGGFAGTVAFSVDGLPAGAGGTFSPNPGSSGSTLTLTVGAAVPANTYALTVTGVSGSTTRTTTVNLTVTAAPAASIDVSATPTSRTIARGGSTTFAITIARTGFSGSVALSASGVPSKASASFSPAPTNGTTSTLTISTLKPVKAGTYPLTITATGSGLTPATTTVTVVIQ